MKLVLLVLSTLFLFSCDTDEEIALKSKLKDPDSYQRISIIENNGYKTIKYRAKNSFGGYVVNKITINSMGEERVKHYGED